MRLFLDWDPSAGWEICLVWENPTVGWDFSLVETLLLVGKFVWCGRIPLLAETRPWLRPFRWLGTLSGLRRSLWGFRLFLDWDPSLVGNFCLVWEDPYVGWDFSLVETLLLVGKLVWFGRTPLLVVTFPTLRSFYWLGTSSDFGGFLCWFRLFLDWDPPAGWELRLVCEDSCVGWDFSLIETVPLVGNFVWFERVPMWVETFHLLRPFCWLRTSSGLGGSLCWLRLFISWDPSVGWEIRLVWEDPSFGWDSIWLRPFCWLGNLSGLRGSLCCLRLFLGWDPSAG